MPRVRRPRPTRTEQRLLTDATLRGAVSGLVGVLVRRLLDHLLG